VLGCCRARCNRRRDGTDVDRDLRYTYFNSFFAFMLRRAYGADAMLGDKACEAVSDDVRRRVVLGHLRRALAGACVGEEIPVSVDDAIVRRYAATGGTRGLRCRRVGDHENVVVPL
jgi:hypothetical protein